MRGPYSVPGVRRVARRQEHGTDSGAMYPLLNNNAAGQSGIIFIATIMR
jgi:hypothetical protein